MTTERGVNDNIVIRILLVAAAVVPLIITSIIRDVISRARR
jgi:hypothetical protein